MDPDFPVSPKALSADAEPCKICNDQATAPRV